MWSMRRQSVSSASDGSRIVTGPVMSPLSQLTHPQLGRSVRPVPGMSGSRSPQRWFGLINGVTVVCIAPRARSPVRLANRRHVR
jgi:hypothetical protein